ncbi:MAG: cupin domain-containing protein [Planctomycetota bacterium]
MARIVSSLVVLVLGAGALALADDPGERAHIVRAAEDLEWKDGPQALPPGAKIAILAGDMKSRELFAVRLKFPKGYKIKPHWHPVDENVTIISGRAHMATGDKFDTAGGHELRAGAFTVMPAKLHHYFWTTEDTIIQLHGIGPWGITYVNPEDDPRPRKE